MTDGSDTTHQRDTTYNFQIHNTRIVIPNFTWNYIKIIVISLYNTPIVILD